MRIATIETSRVVVLRRLHCRRPSESAMIRYYASAGLQLVGLIVTIEALLIYFGDMGPMMQTAAVGVGLFYAGRFLRPKDQ